MARKRPPTNVEREQILKALSPGQSKHLPQFNMSVKKKVPVETPLIRKSKPKGKKIVGPKGF